VIALAADFRILARSASFTFLFTRVGLAGADMGSAYLLPRLVGLGAATELLLLGDRVDSDEAGRLGLATRVVEDDELAGSTGELSERIASGPTFAYAATKALLTRELDMDLQSSIELEAVTQALLMTSGDHKEFYEAFREGRNPVWTGR
jgi:enoyl-CoA hydratase/carnithine racemase